MEESLAGFGDFVHHLLFTFVSGPLKVDSLGWVKYCRLRLEYFRNVSAVLRASVQAFKKLVNRFLPNSDGHS